MLKRIGIIGSTGSIGTQTLELARKFRQKIEIVALAAGSNAKLLAEQTNEFKPELVCIMDDSKVSTLKELINNQLDVEIVTGIDGLKQIARCGSMDTLVTSVTGSVGLEPTLEAIKAGKDIALANKETLVAAGELVMKMADKYKSRILPVDSEHSAIFQALQGNQSKDISRLIITASGGPFRGYTMQELESVNPEQALKHPNWSMGAKITIDSATLMNKGLEVIEAHWLFGMDYDKIDVVVHPQSIIHSLVEYVDSSVIAQLGWPDMKVPIQYALTYPNRWNTDLPKLDLAKCAQLTFERPDYERFPCLALAFECGKEGGNAPVVMNAANEIAVAMFLKKAIGFMDIPKLVRKTVEARKPMKTLDLETILSEDKWARDYILNLVVNN